MSVSAMDTAKLPRSRTESPIAPLPSGAPPLTLASVAEPIPAPGPDRRALRQLRRSQRRAAAVGIAALVAVFLVAVIVLGGIR